ncbi:uncharacterized protein LOC126575345 [Anopheles aquasalis]|uniref:uncharacterized protein LOC126575345 n=1 Tax=Anopheles aquasalis TaxID=42839 RepID=UPI00215A9F91|nr:uncharacterized protein LOC126575345 [Anopheles aquasalis]
MQNFIWVSTATLARQQHRYWRFIRIDLGIMKRLLSGRKDGSLGFEAKLTAQQITEISNISTSVDLPSEIHRKQRGLNCLGYWKGSEFSSFLHYTSLIFLEGNVADSVFEHFLLFFCSITLFSTSYYKKYWTTASKMLEQYVVPSEDLYGSRYITSNVHNLLHVAQEVYRFAPLSTLSVYPTENALGLMKGLIRHGYRILEPAVNRLSKIEEEGNETMEEKTYPIINLCANRKQELVDENFILDCIRKNSFFSTKDNKIIQLKKVEQRTGQPIELFGNEFLSKTDRFSTPIHVSDIRCKLAALDYKNDNYLMVPVVHTLR